MQHAAENNQIFVTLLLLLIVYFLWMDLAMYYKLQTGYDDLLVVQHSKNVSSTMPTYFDPFNPISVKLLMVDHLNHYVYYPACDWLDRNVLHVADKLLFISPDMISITHVVVAAVGAKCVASESLRRRRIGVFLFELRSMLDSYDGMIARARNNTRGLAQVAGSWGYWMDGVCDAVGTVLFFLGAWFLLRRRFKRASMEALPLRASKSMECLLLSEDSKRPPPMKKTSLLARTSTQIIAALLTQQFLSSLFWNRYMEQFHFILETPSPSWTSTQIATLKSSPFWIICWSWKLLNPHALMSALLAIIFFDAADVFFAWFRFLGFVPLIAIVAASELHLQAVKAVF